MSKSFKKMMAVCIAVIMVAFAFAGCSGNHAENENSTTEPITTDSAVIKEADAISLIKTYTAQELQLEGTLDDYRIMVGSSGEKIDNKYYIKVIASKISDPGADGTVTIDTYGQYFISYNGNEILIYNEADGSYTPMADIHEVPESATEAHSHSHDE